MIVFCEDFMVSSIIRFLLFYEILCMVTVQKLCDLPYNKKYGMYRVDEHEREAPGEHVWRAHLGARPQPHEHGARRRQRAQH